MPYAAGMSETSSISKTVTVNGKALTTEASTLAELIRELGHAPEAVATAANGLFVAISARGAAGISGGDAIEIVSAREGG